MAATEGALERAAAWAGLQLDRAQYAAVLRLAAWLEDEAIPAGGLGPAEADRLLPRHLADSLLLAGVWTAPTPPRTVLDVGSGVGLPGLPLAIAWPQAAVTLLDRAARRTALARRAVRVLGLNHVEVVTGSLANHAARYDLVVSRAALPLPAALPALAGRLAPGGTAGLALSRRAAPESLPPAPPQTTLRVLEVPAAVLDSPVWLLRMAARE